MVKSCEENEAHFNLKEAKEFMIHLTIVKSCEENETAEQNDFWSQSFLSRSE
jgi:hypothetical protein